LEGTKRFLEEQVQTAGIGKQVIEEFGGGHGLLAKALGQWGKMIDAAAHGVLDETTARRFRVSVNRIYGRWTDLTPGEQTALMFSPFGMWWTNSVAWLARLPIDHPVITAGVTAATQGTEKQRAKLGLDMLAPNALPLYQQGAIPIGGALWQANYYSPVGVANDPLETMQQLIQPWLSEPLLAGAGVDWHGATITSPSNPGGYKTASVGDRATVILGSLLSSFLPLYTKASQVVEGGASAYDTSTLFAPQTKEPGKGVLAGLEKAVMPVRLGKAGGKSSSASSGYLLGGSSGSSSSGYLLGGSHSSSSSGGYLLP
jgi:hypothetical protein